MKRMALRDCVTGRARGDSHGWTPRRARGSRNGLSLARRWSGTGWWRFGGVDGRRILKEEFEIPCSLSSTYRLLHRIKLSWLAPRPRRPEADATAQAEFSQHLDCN